MNIFKLIKNGEIRTRFAPSPTGPLHVGGCRTALFNYIFAKQHQGRFILRIEDTDKERSKKEYEKDIIENLKWLGIEWDEGPIDAESKEYLGSLGPYRQSERGEIYKKYLKLLFEKNLAYYCFCSPEELEAERQEQMARGVPPRYSGKCASLSREEAERRLAKGEPAVIRFRVLPKKVSFTDMIRKKVEFDSSLFGDFVIAKDLNTPLYNFAAVVDDFEMKITHVIRGEDHLSNTPKQILLQEALGFPTPIYAHLPLILGPDRSKLSKRHGVMAIEDYRKLGYLPEALINFLAFLGWNPGTEREIYSIDALIKDFSMERVQKSGAVFNQKRLDFLNGFYIRNRPVEKITALCIPYLIEAGFLETEEKEKTGGFLAGNYKIRETKEQITFSQLERIISLYQERMKKLSEITQLTDFFFKESIVYEKTLLFWKDIKEEELKEILDNIYKLLSGIKEENWNEESIKNVLLPYAEECKDRGKVLWPFRVALTGKKASAGPFEISAILGKEKTLKRVEKAKEILDKE